MGIVRSTTDQICFAFIRYWRKNGNTKTVHQLFINCKKVYNSVRREVLYNILIKFGVPTELVKLIKMSLNETHSKVCIGERWSNMFPTQYGLKQDALLPLLFNFALEYAIKNVQEIKVRAEIKWDTYHLLAYADDVNLLGDNIENIKKNTEKTNNKLPSCHQNAGQNHYIKMATRSFKNVAQFKYLGMREILNSGGN
jgi:hypothetical protein